MADTSYNDVEKAWGGSAAKSEGNLPKVEYLKIADGETVRVRILENVPLQTFQTEIEVEGKRHPVSVTREDNERVKAAGHKIKKVNAVNVIDRRDGKVKLWQPSDEKLGDVQKIMKSIKALAKLEKLPTEFDIAITKTRIGPKKQEVRYSVDVTENMEPLSTAELALVKPNLVEYFKPNKERLDTLLAGKIPTKRQETSETVQAGKESINQDTPL